MITISFLLSYTLKEFKSTNAPAYAAKLQFFRSWSNGDCSWCISNKLKGMGGFECRDLFSRQNDRTICITYSIQKQDAFSPPSLAF